MSAPYYESVLALMQAQYPTAVRYDIEDGIAVVIRGPGPEPEPGSGPDPRVLQVISLADLAVYRDDALSRDTSLEARVANLEKLVATLVAAKKGPR